jgi:hypothetical protein
MADIIKELILARQNAPSDANRVLFRAAINEIFKLRGQIKDAKVLLSAGVGALGSGTWERDAGEELPDVQPPKPFVPALNSIDDEPF